MNETLNQTSLGLEFHQLSIYNEVREINQRAETYRHILSVLGSILSLFGIIGKYFKFF
jgi:hypothetical protein